MAIKLYEGKEPLQVKAEIIVKVVKDVIEAGEEEEFLTYCNAQGFSAMIDGDTVNDLKAYFDKNKSLSARKSTRRAIDSDRCTT